MPRPHKLNEPTRTTSFILRDSTHLELHGVCHILNEKIVENVTLSDLVRVAVEDMLENATVSYLVKRVAEVNNARLK